jgi:hypothetical protein
MNWGAFNEACCGLLLSTSQQARSEEGGEWEEWEGGPTRCGAQRKRRSMAGVRRGCSKQTICVRALVAAVPSNIFQKEGSCG